LIEELAIIYPFHLPILRMVLPYIVLMLVYLLLKYKVTKK